MTSQEAFKELLGLPCPDCDGYGTVPIHVPEQRVSRTMAMDAGDPSLEGSIYTHEQIDLQQCMWCARRNTAVNVLQREIAWYRRRWPFVSGGCPPMEVIEAFEERNREDACVDLINELVKVFPQLTMTARKIKVVEPGDAPTALGTDGLPQTKEIDPSRIHDQWVVRVDASALGDGLILNIDHNKTLDEASAIIREKLGHTLEGDPSSHATTKD